MRPSKISKMLKEEPISISRDSSALDEIDVILDEADPRAKTDINFNQVKDDKKKRQDERE